MFVHLEVEITTLGLAVDHVVFLYIQIARVVI